MVLWGVNFVEGILKANSYLNIDFREIDLSGSGRRISVYGDFLVASSKPFAMQRRNGHHFEFAMQQLFRNPQH